jgi:ABC-2 type transport system ATP-binding protein
MSKLVEVRGLRKTWGALVALESLDLDLEKGEVCGILGHNGAGKTTAIECMIGVRTSDSGSVSLLEMNPRKNRKELFSRIGVQFQETRFQEKLRVNEACQVASSLYPSPSNWEDLLEEFSLSEKKNTDISSLSGGERQKLSVLLAFIGNPELVFLDELTTGLDPKSRRRLWEWIKQRKTEGVSVLLTSHYMDEVEYLCDRVMILKNGHIIDSGSPDSLKKRYEKNNLEEVFLLRMDEQEEEEAI